MIEWIGAAGAAGAAVKDPFKEFRMNALRNPAECVDELFMIIAFAHSFDVHP